MVFKYTGKLGKRTAKAYSAAGGRGRGLRAAAGSVAKDTRAATWKVLSESAKDAVNPSGKFWGIFSKNKTILGINVGVGAFLKQSQLFNTSIASILQIIGAIVDVFLAPFIIPLFVPLIKKLAGLVPKVGEWSQELADKYVPLISDMLSDIWNGDGSFLGKIKDSIIGFVSLVWNETGLADWWNNNEGIIKDFRQAMSAIITMLEKLGLIDKKPDTGLDVAEKIMHAEQGDMTGGAHGAYSGTYYQDARRNRDNAALLHEQLMMSQGGRHGYQSDVAMAQSAYWTGDTEGISNRAGNRKGHMTVNEVASMNQRYEGGLWNSIDAYKTGIDVNYFGIPS